MAQFSAASLKELNTCHTDLVILFMQVVQHYDCTVVDGYRTEAEQNKYFNIGASTVKYPTVHNTKPSFAVDVAPFIKGRVSWDEKQCKHFAGFVKAMALMLLEQGKITHRLRCGVDWNSDYDVNDHKFKDDCHFELVPNDGEVLNYQPC